VLIGTLRDGFFVGILKARKLWIAFVLAFFLFVPLFGLYAQTSAPASEPWEIVISSSPEEGGTTSPAGTLSVEQQGTTLNVAATPATNWICSGWELDGEPYSPSKLFANVEQITETIIVQSQSPGTNHSLVAIFKHAPYVLTVNKEGGGGMINIFVADNPVGGTAGKYRIADGEAATVKLYKSPGTYRLDHWTLDGESYTTTLPNFTMNENHDVTAYFVPNNHIVDITCTEGGTTDPTGTQQYPVNDPDGFGLEVTVTATADNDYHFDHWIFDDKNETSNPASFVLPAGVNGINYSLKAVFTHDVTQTPTSNPQQDSPSNNAPTPSEPEITTPTSTVTPSIPPTTAPPTSSPTNQPTTEATTTAPPTPENTATVTSEPSIEQTTPTQTITPINASPTASPVSSETDDVFPTFYVIIGVVSAVIIVVAVIIYKRYMKQNKKPPSLGRYPRAPQNDSF
jgi:hypothetical protein